MKPFGSSLGNPTGSPVLICLVLSLLAGTAAEPKALLSNGKLSAEFRAGALVRLTDMATKQTVDFGSETSAVKIDGREIGLSSLRLRDTKRSKDSLTFSYTAEDIGVATVYQLKPDWRFISKQILITLPPGSTSRVDSITALTAALGNQPGRELRPTANTGTVFLRDANPGSRSGIFFSLQNPFMKWERQDARITLSYAPEMEWRASYGPFASDRVCLGLYLRSGQEFPLHNLGEWKYVPEPAHAFEGKPALDWAEIDAAIRCVEAFQLFRLKKSLNVHVPWCENDYQIDVGTSAGRTEWKRIIDQAAAVGCEHTLFTPANSAVSQLNENADAWGWENCLWLGLGQKIRKGEWNIKSDPIPPSIQEMLDYAKSKDIKFVAYAYPTLGWKQNPEWTAWCGGKTGGYIGADTGVRSFQDWFVDQLVAFQKRTGISGYSFDHWWIAYEAKDGLTPTSKYAQWSGCRRILEELRRRVPDIVIDGRQQYQWFGPWTWLGGSYPHPTTNDEQPGSFENFPDLHFSRVSGDRQRWAAWWYRMEQFTPLDLLPGYMTHQTPRNDPQGQCVRDRPFQIRDWDYLGWKYSVLSSIATAPFNNVIDLLPARDMDEFRHFRPDDQLWLKRWLRWTDKNREFLANLRPIIGPPAFGRIDGTAAVAGDRGYLFLFNPNYRSLEAGFRLDGGIGLVCGDAFLLRELYPREGRLLGKPGAGAWALGDEVRLPIKGPQAVALEIVPRRELRGPVVLGSSGEARVQGSQLTLVNLSGECGTRAEIQVLLPSNRTIKSVTVNGRNFKGFSQRDTLLTLSIGFAGARFDHCQQLGEPGPGFKDTVFRAEFKIPQQVFDQLAKRRQAWPIPYTQEDLLATWRGPGRLLLYAHIADPDDRWNPSLKIDGQAVELKKAYSDVYPLGRERTFTGFYADVSNRKADVACQLELTLPEGLQPGQFQGLFLENVEAEDTNELRQEN